VDGAICVASARSVAKKSRTWTVEYSYYGPRKMQPVLDFTARSVVWIVAIALWTSLNKPDDIPVVPVWAGAPTIVGAIIVAAGIALYSAGAWTLACSLRVQGDMPVALLTKGPFARVRNPIYLGAAIVVVGLTFVYQMPVWTYAKLALLFVAAHLAVVLLEEPQVRKRFGPAYDEYCRRVPRWMFPTTGRPSNRTPD
jgi:protein-S-isoprenylcysteine O-methyltransferase Ste14